MSKQSRYTGVSYLSGRSKPWRARVSIGNSTFSLGYFKSQTEAARMYNDFIKANKLDRSLNLVR